MDIREDMEDQEGRIISFYKVPKVDWARPLYCKLEGNGTSTVLFEGQVDHLIPSTSQVLVSDLFLMAGKMIGHSFLHGGPLLAGLSSAIIHVLLGGSLQTTTILLEDVVDIDIRETLQLVVLDNIIWPSKEETDNDDDDGFPVPVKCRIDGYLWEFVETGIS
ncbi:hypothetical protein MHYP_G00275620 [Metynnis hypsauchen]